MKIDAFYSTIEGPNPRAKDGRFNHTIANESDFGPKWMIVFTFVSLL